MAGIGAKLAESLLSKEESALISAGERVAGTAESRLEATAVKALESQVAKAETALDKIEVDLPKSTYHAPAKPPGKAPSGMMYVLKGGRWVLKKTGQALTTKPALFVGGGVAGLTGTTIIGNMVQQCTLRGWGANDEGFMNTIQKTECATLGTSFTCNCGPHVDESGNPLPPKKGPKELAKELADKAMAVLDAEKERLRQMKEDTSSAIKNTKEKTKEKLSDIAGDNPLADLHSNLNDMNLPTPQVNIPGAAEGTMVVVAVAVVLGLSFVLIRG